MFRSIRSLILVVGAALALLASFAASAQVIIGQPPTPNAGVDRTVADTDGLPGENVLLDASGSVDPDGIIIAYAWTDGQGVPLASGPQVSVRLPDGVSQVILVLSYPADNGDNGTTTATATDAATITVGATQLPVANAGGSRAVPDTDRLAGEAITLDAGASSDPDGSIVSYQWFLAQNTLLGTGPVLQNVQLPDGANQITLVITDNVGNTATDTIVITIGGGAARTGLADAAGLSPNQRSTASVLDDLCVRLAELQRQQPLTAQQSDLLARCNGVIFDSTSAEQQQALEQMGAQEIEAMRTQTLMFATQQNSNVMDRMMSLRGGARGLDVAGSALNSGGTGLPLAELAHSLRAALGGGASADGADNDLLGERLGLWMRGNYNWGEKTRSPASGGFKSDQWSVTGGIDYRFTDRIVAGMGLGYGTANMNFNPGDRGGMDTTSWMLSAYGSTYVMDNLYVDAVLNYTRSDYDTERHIVYTEGGVPIDRRAQGSTDGTTLSVGLSVGYELAWKGFTIAPSASYLYADMDADGYSEHGASGLDLAYANQSYKSSSATAGLRMSYAWNTSWCVLLPHVRSQFVREFQNDVEVFGVRFANDPFADGDDPTAPIVVRSDVPDGSYWRWAAGLAAQFKYGISGYIEYQRLDAFSYLDFEEVTLGVRLQRRTP